MNVSIMLKILADVSIM